MPEKFRMISEYKQKEKQKKAHDDYFNLASLDNRFGKVPLQRKLTRYMLDFENIEKLIFEVIPSIS